MLWEENFFQFARGRAGSGVERQAAQQHFPFWRLPHGQARRWKRGVFGFQRRAPGKRVDAFHQFYNSAAGGEDIIGKGGGMPFKSFW